MFARVVRRGFKAPNQGAAVSLGGVPGRRLWEGRRAWLFRPMAAGMGSEPWDFGNTVHIIRGIPQDLFAELCEQISQYLQCQIPAVNTIELCKRFQAAGIEIAASDLAKVANVISFIFSTAAKNKLSSEDLSTRLGHTVSSLPKPAIQAIRHVWNEQGRSITVAENAKNVVAVGQLIDFQWKLGVAVSSDHCKALKSPYVTMVVKVAEASGHITSKTFEMTVPQFQNFHSQFKEMAGVLETV